MYNKIYIKKPKIMLIICEDVFSGTTIENDIISIKK